MNQTHLPYLAKYLNNQDANTDTNTEIKVQCKFKSTKSAKNSNFYNKHQLTDEILNNSKSFTNFIKSLKSPANSITHLSIKNTKLVAKQLTSIIDAILANPACMITTLDISNTSLNTTTVYKIIELIEANKIIELDISNNHLGLAGITSLFHNISKLTKNKLNKLSIRGNIRNAYNICKHWDPQKELGANLKKYGIDNDLFYSNDAETTRVILLH